MSERKPFNVCCVGCQHEWVAAYLPMNIASLARLLEGLHCPGCGRDSTLIKVAKETPHG